MTIDTREPLNERVYLAPYDPTWPSSYEVTWFELCATRLTTGSGP